MVSFIHTADWQLGMTRHFLDSDAQARFSAARIEVIRRIGRLATERECSFVVVCGDVFETNHVERQVIVRALDAMSESPDVTFYLLPGNHDPLTASSVFASETFVSHCPENVEALTAEGVIEVESGVQLVAAPWTSKEPLEDLVARAILGAAGGGDVQIAVGHGAVDVLSPNAHDVAVIQLDRLEAALADTSLQYVALGDRHSTTSVGTSGRVWYSGAPEPTAYREIDPGNALLVVLEDGGVDVSTVPVGDWRFLTLEFDLRSGEDVDRLESGLSGLESKSVTIVQLQLVGQLSLGDKVRLDTVLDHFADLFASLSTWDRRTDLVVLPDDDDFTSLGLSGFAQDALDDLVKLAQDETPEAANAQESLGLLYRLAGGSS